MPDRTIVRGRCLGGGFEVALACDLVFASHDAKLGVPEITLGVFPPAAAALLPLRVGASRASRAVLTGEIFAADWWEAAGLVSGVASPTDLDAFVHHWSRRSWRRDRRSRSGTPRSRRERSCASRCSRRSGRLERRYLDELMLSADAAEGCAAFLEKRPPQWRHS